METNPLPILWTDPRYAHLRNKRPVVTHDGVASYDKLSQDRNTAIARVAEAMADMPARGNAAYAGRKAVYTRRTRELALTVGAENWAAAEAEAKVLADDLRAYWARVRAAL